MLRDIIRKEILENIVSPKFVFTFLLCTVLILLSVYGGVANYRMDKKEHAASVAMNRQLIENQAEPIEVLENYVLYKSPQALGAVVNGIEGAVGRAVVMPKLYMDPRLKGSKFGSSPIFAAFGALDLIFIVKIVLSLFAILFTYDAITGEKENGTLKLALANNVPRDRLILGKAIGGYISLLLPLLIPATLSVIVFLLVPDLALSGADWIRLFIIFFMFLTYLSVFFSLGLFVSARTQRSSTSFLILLFIWAVFVMIIPKVAIVAANQIRPIPSPHEINTKKEAVTAQDTQESMKEFMDYLKTHRPGKTDEEQKTYSDNLRIFLDDANKKRSIKVVRTLSALERDYQLRKKSQQDLAANFSRISPASALTFGSMSLARTGIDESNRFLASIEAYKQVYLNWFQVKSKYRESLGKNKPKFNIYDMPQHSFEPEGLKDSLIRALPDFGAMFVMIVICFAGAYFSFLRYDVR